MTPRRLYLAEWRKHYKISRATVAKRCGVDTYTVTRWENGKRQITAAKIAAYGHAIGIPNIGWLWQHPDEVFGASHIVTGGLLGPAPIPGYPKPLPAIIPAGRIPWRTGDRSPTLLTRIRDFLSAFFRKHQAKGA